MTKITHRKVNYNDSKDILAWRNNINTRKMYLNSNYISKNTHESWFEKTFNDKNKIMWIFEKEIEQKSKIGVIRYDLNSIKSEANISININPKLRGNGYGYKCLKISLDLIKKNVPFCEKVLAKVKIKNKASISIFVKNSFEKTKTDENFFYFERKL